MGEPRMVHYQPPKDWQQWVQWLAAGLHGRNRWRLALILLGIVFARGRRTVTSWLRAVGISADFADYYYFLQHRGSQLQYVKSAGETPAPQHLRCRTARPPLDVNPQGNSDREKANTNPLRDRPARAEQPALVAADHFEQKARHRMQRQKEREDFAVVPAVRKEEPQYQRQQRGIDRGVELRRMNRHAPRR